MHGRVHVAADGQYRAASWPEAGYGSVAGPDLTVIRCADSPSFLRQLRDKVHFGLPLKPADDLPREREPL